MTQLHQEIARHCEELSSEMIDLHLKRVPDDYLEAFTPEVIGDHLRAIDRLSENHPVEVMIQPLEDNRIACTVIAFDHPFEFSLITGTLAGASVNIESGDVYTLEAVNRSRHTRRHSPMHRSRIERNACTDAIIIDRFTGRRDAIQTDREHDDWANRLVKTINDVIALLEKADDASIQQAKQLVNESVTNRLAGMSAHAQPKLFPVDIDIRETESQRIRLVITGQDTPAFLYALSTALSLRGLSIDRVRINADGETGQFTDVLDLVPSRLDIRIDTALLEHIKLSALLTKQFTYFLERSPDPYTALTRFENLTESFLAGTDVTQREQWINLLVNPHTMRDLAKLLGTSDFLWEDFIRGQYESLLPIIDRHVEYHQFSQPPETLPARLDDALQHAVGLAEKQDRINRFKDREIFQIDLDQILNPVMTFREFSERLTWLAEHLVATTSRLIYDDLVYSYGPPECEGTHSDDKAVNINVPYAVFGLGKLGGVALGYGSDIELLYVYDCPPGSMTAGGKRDGITCSEFFELLARESSQFIKTKREGIFQVDLRLRPYGKEGPLACHLQQFSEYYGPTGSAHAFERLALVRLRWIAGNPALGSRIESLRDQFIYENTSRVLDYDALWEIWIRVKQEKLGRETRLNAKYSPGALVDLEGITQLLQVGQAAEVPQLRSPRLAQAMEALQRGGVLNNTEYASLRSAYDFLRQLINALRMLRGSAQDLFLPPQNSLELTHLARRMGYSERDLDTNMPPGEKLMNDYETHTQAVRRFIQEHFNQPCPTQEP